MSKVLGEKIMEIVEQFEVPQEYHHALWEAYSAGADYGFFKCLDRPTPSTPLIDEKGK